MVYQNKGGQPREKVMMAAYWLVKEAGAKQHDVARVFGCHQSTISGWVKEVSFKREIQGLERELAEAREYAEEVYRYLE